MTLICCCDDDTCNVTFLNNRVCVLETLCGLNINDYVVNSIKKIQNFYKNTKKIRRLTHERSSTIITKNYKKFVCFNIYSTKRKAACVIQKCFRGHKHRNTLFYNALNKLLIEKKKVKQLEASIYRIKKNNKYRFQNQNKVKNNFVQSKQFF